MNVTIFILTLGFCYSGCYSNPNHCVCAQNGEVPSPTQTGLRPYDHEQVQERLEDPEMLVPRMRQRSETGSGGSAPIRYRKNQVNFQKSKQSENELGQYSESGNRFKQEKILSNLLELFELPKRANLGNKTYKHMINTGEYGVLPNRPGKKRENSGQIGGRGATKEEEPKWEVGFAYTGSGNPPIIRNGRRFFRPDMQQQEYVREPDLSADAIYRDYEYEL